MFSSSFAHFSHFSIRPRLSWFNDEMIGALSKAVLFIVYLFYLVVGKENKCSITNI